MVREVIMGKKIIANDGALLKLPMKSDKTAGQNIKVPKSPTNNAKPKGK